MKESNYKGKWSQQVSDMKWMSNHKKRKDKSKKEKNRGKLQHQWIRGESREDINIELLDIKEGACLKNQSSKVGSL